MTTPIETLIQVLALETLDANLFRGHHEKFVSSRLFGGQVLAQALAAADLTVPETRQCHSMHGYFLRPGSPKLPVIYRVERIRDGRSFNTRRIVAVQRGEAIFNMDASYQVAEAGLEHQLPMASFPQPEDLEDDVDIARRAEHPDPWRTRERPFESRSCHQTGQYDGKPLNPVWLRIRPLSAPLSDRQQQQLLAYASDMGFVSTSFLPHQETNSRDQLQMASLDHALWLHGTADVREWLLYVKGSTNASGSRGFNRGEFYTRDGRLLASSMQEGLMRLSATAVPSTAEDPAI